MRRYSYTARTHVKHVGIDVIIVTLSCIYSYLWHCWMKLPGPTLRVLLRETGSSLDIRLVPYMRLAGVRLSYNSEYGIYNGGPRPGFRETIIISVLWL